MARGGHRPGAGRKAGIKTEKTKRRIAYSEEAAASGVTPLEVMLSAMRQSYAEGKMKDAASFAKDAAPYIHPRLATIEHGGPGGGPINHSIEVVFVDASDSGPQNEG